MFFNKELIGIDAICRELEINNAALVIEFFVHNFLPMVKKDGQWTASKRELLEWKDQHHDLFAPPKEIFVRLKIKQPRRRWGF